MLWIRISLKYKVAFLNRPLAYYNQDSDTTWRAIGRLQNPKCHMLWNLDDLAEIENSNSDYKQLIDNLRTYGLFPYYLSREYREDARRELQKVEWNNQPAKVRRRYSQPIFFTIFKYRVLKVGLTIKQWIIRHI